jgi:hypothetical protein
MAPLAPFRGKETAVKFISSPEGARRSPTRRSPIARPSATLGIASPDARFERLARNDKSRSRHCEKPKPRATDTEGTFHAFSLALRAVTG